MQADPCRRHRGDGEDRAGRQVEPAGDDHQRAGHRHDGEGRVLGEDVEQVAAGEEGVARQGEDDHQHDDQDQHAVAAADVRRRRRQPERASVDVGVDVGSGHGRAAGGFECHQPRRLGRSGGAVDGGEDPRQRLVGVELAGGHLADDPTVAHQQRAVGHAEHLLELGGDQHDGGAGAGDVDDRFVDAALARRRRRRASARRESTRAACRTASERTRASAGCRPKGSSPAPLGPADRRRPVRAAYGRGPARPPAAAGCASIPRRDWRTWCSPPG